MIGVNLKYSVVKELITSFFCMLSILSLSAQDSYSSLSREYAPGALESLSPSVGNYVETAMGLNLRMVFVDGGTFEMGATAEQAKDAANTERPVRRITMSPYYIGMFEITQEQWKKVMGTTVQDLGHDMRGVGEDFPMYYVSWDDAMEFCQKLSEQSGKTYTLPTEAQWEFAARGGVYSKKTKYSGSPYANVVSWNADNSVKKTHAVGTKAGNELGIYDMCGNVWEWCLDWYGDYRVYDTSDPQGAASGTTRVNRGGSWLSSAKFCRVSTRDNDRPTLRGNNLGFRVVMIP